MQDEIWVERLQQGDRTAFDELYTRYRDEALRTASLITGSRADGEDVVQEAFVQCYQRIGQLRDRSKFKAWLFTLLTRTAWKYCRKRGREEPVSEFFDDAEKAGESTLGAVLRTEQSRELFAAVQALDDKQRTVVVLYYYIDMPVRDIAHVLGCREGTVKSRLFSARRNLQKAMGQKTDEWEGVRI